MADFAVVHLILGYCILSLLKRVPKVDAKGCDAQSLSHDYLPGS